MRSFATAPAAGSVEYLTWRMSFPAERHAAHVALRRHRQQVARTTEALRQAEVRLDRLRARPLPGGVVFGGETREQLPAAEAALWHAFRMIGAPGGPVPFAGSAAKHTPAQALLARFRRLLAHYAYVESAQGMQPVAVTTVSWQGDVTTTWQSPLSSEAMSLHREAVQLALASRLALLRMVTVVGSGALGLALKAALPGAQLLLLPAVYQFIWDVVKEAQKREVVQK